MSALVRLRRCLFQNGNGCKKLADAGGYAKLFSMSTMSPLFYSQKCAYVRQFGFSRIELVVVLAMIAIFAEIFLPALGQNKARNKTTSIQCINNMHQVITAWQLYALDFNERVVNNYGLSETINEINTKRFGNWANNVMTWTASGLDGQSVTNEMWVKNGVFAPYARQSIRIFKCPGDNFLSTAQKAAGYKERLRSFAMNAFFGRFSNGDDPTKSGKNWGMPDYKQFLKTTQVHSPAKTWVIVEEQADSINDGYFINTAAPSAWGDVPATYHNGGTGFSFADGHSESHKWKSPTSVYTVKYQYSNRAFDAAGRNIDWKWYYDNTGYVKF
jgi:prepilin-type processing-associated H-X9-DG protein